MLLVVIISLVFLQLSMLRSKPKKTTHIHGVLHHHHHIQQIPSSESLSTNKCPDAYLFKNTRAHDMESNFVVSDGIELLANARAFASKHLDSSIWKFDSPQIRFAQCHPFRAGPSFSSNRRLLPHARLSLPYKMRHLPESIRASKSN